MNAYGVVQDTLMTIRRAMLAVVSSTVVFSVIGLAIGSGLGSFAPNYYRDMYEGGHSAKFDPVAMGAGLGVMQGASLAGTPWWDLAWSGLLHRGTRQGKPPPVRDKRVTPEVSKR